MTSRDRESLNELRQKCEDLLAKVVKENGFANDVDITRAKVIMSEKQCRTLIKNIIIRDGKTPSQLLDSLVNTVRFTDVE